MFNGKRRRSKRISKKPSVIKPVENMKAFLFKFANSKVGWIANKLAASVASLLAGVAFVSDEHKQQLGVAVAAAVTWLLTWLLDVASTYGHRKIVGEVQFSNGLTVDHWAGPKTCKSCGIYE